MEYAQGTYVEGFLVLDFLIFLDSYFCGASAHIDIDAVMLIEIWIEQEELGFF